MPKPDEARSFQVRNEIMSTSETVRFNLFGGFVAIVDGNEVTFPERDFFSYLKLLLLSGKTSLELSEAFSSVPVAKRVRDVLDLGNSAPGLISKGGRYAFKEKTGLILKYREGYGLVLRGADSESDVREFERIWDERSDKSEQDLQHALDIYGSGIDLGTWIKDSIVVESREWIKTRLHLLQEHRNDIKAELDSRLDSEELDRGETGSNAMSGVPQGWSDEEETHHETSGLSDRPDELKAGDTSSAPLREPLRQDAPTEDLAEVPSSQDPGVIDDASPGEAASEERVVKLLVESSGHPSGSDSEKSSSKSQSGAGGSGPPPTRRNVTALGVVVAASIVLLVFAVGYLIAAASNRQEGPPVSELGRIGPTSAPETGKGGSSSGKKASDEEQPIVRAPETSVALETLFLKQLGSMGTVAEDKDVVIGRQLFSNYTHPEQYGEEAAPAYKLDGDYTTLKCVVGVPDEEVQYFESDARQVLFEGDGKVLKRVSVKPGSPIPVTVSVEGIKVIIITFRSPVVIASPRVHRQ